MTTLVRLIEFAGILQLCIAAANFFAIRRFHYRAEISKLSPVVREVFIVQNVFIVLSVVAYSVLCLWFAADLVGPGRLGRLFTAFMAIFWILRLTMQIGYYDAAIKRENRFFNLLFVATFAYLSAVFSAAFLGSSG